MMAESGWEHWERGDAEGTHIVWDNGRLTLTGPHLGTGSDATLSVELPEVVSLTERLAKRDAEVLILRGRIEELEGRG